MSACASCGARPGERHTAHCRVAPELTKAGDPMAEGAPAVDFRGHPRVTAKQRDAVAGALLLDQEARILGLDRAEAIVLRVRAPTTLDPRTYAVTRQGRQRAALMPVREGWAK